MLNQILTAFHTAGLNPELEHDFGEDFFDIGITDSDGIFDVLHVEPSDGRITWHDFSHSTDLGPLDGSEIVERLDAWMQSKRS